MTTDPETVPGAYAREHPKHWIGITAEDIPHGWIDDMVKRLFEELNRQMLRAHNSSENALVKKTDNTYDDDTGRRDTDSLILTRLQNSLSRLNKLDTERATLRHTKAARTRRATRAALRQKFLEAIQPGTDCEGSGGV